MMLVLAAAAAITAGCSSDEPARAVDGDAVAVEEALRAFERAVAAADRDAYLALTTPAYVETTLKAARLSGEQFEDDPDRLLGQQLQREIEDVALDGDTAVVRATLRGGGTQDTSAVEVRLVRRDGSWLVDYTGPRVSTIPKDQQVVTVGLSDFAFDFRADDLPEGAKVVLRARNTGEQPHMIGLWRIPEDADVIHLIEATDGEPAGVEHLAHSVVFAPGKSGDVVLSERLEAGRYAFICFLGDFTVPELTPHYDRGMATPFHVRAR